MARQVIDVGTVPNDNTGTPFRDVCLMINDMTEELYFVPGYAQLTRSANQTINNNTVTAIQWDTEQFDNANIWTIGQPERLTFSGVEGQGIVTIIANFVWAANSTGRRSIYFYKNGAVLSPINSGERVLATTDGGVMLQSAMVRADAVQGDYFEVRVDQTISGGGTLTVTGRVTVDIITI